MVVYSVRAWLGACVFTFVWSLSLSLSDYVISTLKINQSPPAVTASELVQSQCWSYKKSLMGAAGVRGRHTLRLAGSIVDPFCLRTTLFSPPCSLVCSLKSRLQCTEANYCHKKKKKLPMWKLYSYNKTFSRYTRYSRSVTFTSGILCSHNRAEFCRDAT